MGAIDVNLLLWYGDTGPGSSYVAPILTKGDVRRFHFYFADGDAVVPLETNDVARLFLLGPQNQILTIAGADQVNEGDASIYTFDLALVSPEIDQLFAGSSVTSVSVRLVVAFTYQGRHSTSAAVETTLYRNYASAFSHPPPGPPDLSGRASTEQAVAGTNNNSWMTPLTTKQAIEVFAGSNTYNPAVGDAVTSIQVGGSTPLAASGWRLLNFSQALDRILFPTLPPTIGTPKSASLSVSGAAGVQEVGSVVARTLTAAFDRGRITNGDGSLGPELVGAASTFTYSGTGISNTTNASLGNIAVVLGNNQWSVSIAHAAGTGAYTDNKGNASTALDGDRAQGTIAASTAAFTGVYPWYRLVSPVSFTAEQFAQAIETGNASAIHVSAVLTKNVANASGTIAVPYNVNGLFLGVAYEASLTTKTRYYVDDLDNGDISLVFNAAQSAADVGTSLWETDYTIHISKNPLTNTNAIIELRNS